MFKQEKKTKHVEIIYFVTLLIRVTIKTRCGLWGEAEREGYLAVLRHYGCNGYISLQILND